MGTSSSVDGCPDRATSKSSGSSIVKYCIGDLELVVHGRGLDIQMGTHHKRTISPKLCHEFFQVMRGMERFFDSKVGRRNLVSPIEAVQDEAILRED